MALIKRPRDDTKKWKVTLDPRDFPLVWDEDQQRFLTARGYRTVEIQVED